MPSAIIATNRIVEVHKYIFSVSRQATDPVKGEGFSSRALILFRKMIPLSARSTAVMCIDRLYVTR